MSDFHEELKDKLWTQYGLVGHQGERFMYDSDFDSALDAYRDATRAALAEPAPVPVPLNIIFDGPPSPQGPRFVEVETDDGHSVRAGDWIERPDGLWALRITGLTPAPVPVPVSERLPGAEDCDAEGRCWAFCANSMHWRLMPASWLTDAGYRHVYTHWLPATALPLPGEVAL